MEGLTDSGPGRALQRLDRAIRTRSSVKWKKGRNAKAIRMCSRFAASGTSMMIACSRLADSQPVVDTSGRPTQDNPKATTNRQVKKIREDQSWSNISRAGLSTGIPVCLYDLPRTGGYKIHFYEEEHAGDPLIPAHHAGAKEASLARSTRNGQAVRKAPWRVEKWLYDREHRSTVRELPMR